MPMSSECPFKHQYAVRQFGKADTKNKELILSPALGGFAKFWTHMLFEITIKGDEDVDGQACC